MDYNTQSEICQEVFCEECDEPLITEDEKDYGICNECYYPFDN